MDLPLEQTFILNIQHNFVVYEFFIIRLFFYLLTSFFILIFILTKFFKVLNFFEEDDNEVLSNLLMISFLCCFIWVIDKIFNDFLFNRLNTLLQTLFFILVFFFVLKVKVIWFCYNIFLPIIDVKIFYSLVLQKPFKIFFIAPIKIHDIIFAFLVFIKFVAIFSFFILIFFLTITFITFIWLFY